MADLSIYVHWPYCPSRCHYCDFNTYAVGRGAPRLFEDYLAALKAELRGRLGEIPTGPGGAFPRVQTIFFGGGTPSLIPPESVAQWMDLLRSLLPVAEDAEVTLEANPGTVSTERLEGFGRAGVNRLSLGVQSLQDTELRFLGRLHDAETARKAVQCARRAGFENFSLDLIHGLPNQTLPEWGETLDGALEMRPPHLSAYELTLEPGTPLARRLSFTLSEERLAEMHLWTQERLSAAGYEHYETSNYARPGFRCRHNLVYWRGGDYLGLGAGAHSYLGGLRSRNIRPPEAYQASVRERGHAVEETERLAPLRAAGEALMMGLRLREGVDLAEVGERTGCAPLEAFAEVFPGLVEAGYLIREGSRIRLTDAGRLVSDAVAEQFL
ncbi:MAG: radical SAM family heme chaperone HemW [Candidatus Tectomicrobia bacterium]|nr:radical SAM family heme chaperone HemW [Candidatus Tectomicrobia bacterium]